MTPTTEKKLSKKKNQNQMEEIDVMSIISSEEDTSPKKNKTHESSLPNTDQLAQAPNLIQKITEPQLEANRQQATEIGKPTNESKSQARQSSSWSVGKEIPVKISAPNFTRPSPSLSQNLSKLSSKHYTAKQSNSKLKTNKSASQPLTNQAPEIPAQTPNTENKKRISGSQEFANGNLENKTNVKEKSRAEINRESMLAREDKSDSNSQRSQSQKSIKQLLSIQPLDMPAPSSKNSISKLNEKKLKKLAQVKENLAAKKKKIDISESTSNLTSVSKLDTVKMTVPNVAEENNSANLTNFVPQSEVSQSNIMMELSQVSESKKDDQQLKNPQPNAIEMGQENLDTAVQQDAIIRENNSQPGESLNSIELEKQSAQAKKFDLSTAKKSQKVKSKHSSLKKITQEENQELHSSIQSISKRTLKTSNLTPQKPSGPDLQEHLAAEQQMTFQSASSQQHFHHTQPENNSFSSVLDSQSRIQNDGPVVEAYAGSQAKANISRFDLSPQNVEKSPEVNFGTLSMEKSQNLEINLDEYSPITVGYSNKFTRLNWDNPNPEFRIAQDQTLTNTERKKSSAQVQAEKTPEKIQEKQSQPAIVELSNLKSNDPEPISNSRESL